jgi:hypothetical protein
VIVHIALFAWKPGIPEDTIREIATTIQSLKMKIPGVLEIYFGQNFSKWNKGFTHAFVVITKDKQALELYRNHPDHKAIAAEIDSIEAKSIGVDFEV